MVHNPLKRPYSWGGGGGVAFEWVGPIHMGITTQEMFMNFTMRGTKKSRLGNRNIIFKYTLGGDILVPSKVVIYRISWRFFGYLWWLISPPKSICQKNPGNSPGEGLRLAFLGDMSRLHKPLTQSPQNQKYGLKLKRQTMKFVGSHGYQYQISEIYI